MMPLTFYKIGESGKIARVSGSEEVRSHLNDLGFVVGGQISIVNELAGNIIVNVKESRVAIDKNMANKIMVESV